MLSLRSALTAVFLAVLGLSGTRAIADEGAIGADSRSIREIQVASNAFLRADPLPAWVRNVEPQPSARKDPVVVLLADTQFWAADVPATFVNRAIQVNDRASLGVIGQFTLSFEPSYQKLRLHSAKILRGAEVLDRTQTVETRFLQRETSLENGQYNGMVSAMLLLSDVRVGDILHIKYTIEGENPVFSGKFSAFAAWDDSRPIELRSVTLSHPVERHIDWRMLGDFRQASINPAVATVKGHRVLRWEERGLDGIDTELHQPASFLAYRMIQFSEYPDWNAVAVWADGLFGKRQPLNDELKAVVQRLQRLSGEEARTVAALQWVQDKVRYFSVALGESSHRPRPAAEVAERRYGDCKDKANLLLALLHELGISAHPVLVAAHTGKSTAKFLPSPHVFDHVVVHVRVDGTDWYVDGTRIGQSGRLARMGTALHGSQVLPVAANTDDLHVIEVPDNLELNTSDLKEKIVLSAFNAPGHLLAKRTWNGAAAEGVRLGQAQSTADQRRRFALSNYEQRYPGIELEGVPEFVDDPEQNHITMITRYKVPGIAKEYGGDWAVQVFPNNLRGIFNLPQQGNRKLPLTPMHYPYAAHYRLEVEWPESVAMMMDPSTDKAKSDFFTLEVSRAFRGNQAKLDLKFVADVETVSAAQLPRLLEDIKEFDRVVGNSIVVRRGAIKNAGFLGIGKSSLQENMQAQLRNRIAQVGKAISSGRLKGHDLASAYCDRAEAYSDVGEAAEGLKDAAEAVRLAPDHGRAWICRGNLLFAVGQYAKAVSDYGKALSLGEAGFHTFYRRGHAHFYQGKLADAQDDFAKAVAESTDESDILYAQLWQAWTTQLLKRELPPDLARHLAKDPTGAWPRPAAAMLVGALTPEQVLEEVNRKQGDERELTSAEAYFYVGQHYLASGKTAQATEAFRQVRLRGITMYIEHVAAGIELERLKQAH